MRYAGDSLQYFKTTDGLKTGRITGIVEDNKGNIWFGTYLGLLRYDGQTFQRFTDKVDFGSVAGADFFGTMITVS